VVQHHGVHNLEKKQAKLKVNFTNKNEIIELIGPPSTKSSFDNDLYISEVKVDSGRMLKRIQPAPQGRAHRIRKRSNHVTLVVDSRIKKDLK